MGQSTRRVQDRPLLTAAGRTLLHDGRRLLHDAQRVVADTRRAGTDTLTVGFYGSAGTALLPEVLHAFSLTHPTTTVTIRELLFGDLDNVVQRRVDVAFTRLHPGQVAGLGLELRVLATEPQRWQAEQERHGLPGRSAGHAGSLQELLTRIATGQGISLVPASVPERHPRPDLRFVAVTDADAAVVSLLWAPEPGQAIRDAFMAAAAAVAGRAPAAAARAAIAGARSSRAAEEANYGCGPARGASFWSA